MDQRLVQALVALGQVDVLADDADRDAVLRVLEGVDDPPPLLERRLAAPDVEHLADLVVEPLGPQHHRDLVDDVLVGQRDDAVGAHVGEQRQLVARALADRLLGRHTSRSGWMPISRIFITECWVGLVFSSPAVRMNGSSVRCTNTVSRGSSVQRAAGGSPRGTGGLDVADGPADLDDQEVEPLGGARGCSCGSRW